jgi:hypothetical protein
MRAYCTYFDHNYLARGMVLYESLRQHGGSSTLWVLCLSASCYETLKKLSLPGLELISLDEFQSGDAPLLAARQNRSPIEFFFTCTPSLPLFIFNKAADVDEVTYLDGDLCFFTSPELAHAEIGDASIAITPHRFTPPLRGLERYGIFNVGWLTFKRDEAGLACLQWWRERCLEWCYDREEDGRFADQKYLNDWPARFQKVKVLDHPGINLAPWNLSNYRLSLRAGRVFADEYPLIIFHFQGLKQLSANIFDPQWRQYQITPGAVVKKHVYQPYLHELENVTRKLGLERKNIAFNPRLQSAGGKASIWRRGRARLGLWRDVVRGKYIRCPPA